MDEGETGVETGAAFARCGPWIVGRGPWAVDSYATQHAGEKKVCFRLNRGCDWCVPGVLAKQLCSSVTVHGVLRNTHEENNTLRSVFLAETPSPALSGAIVD